MCRIAAFPPKFPKEYALKYIARFAKGNGDGTGSVYLKDGEFVVNKWPISLAKVVYREYPLLDHMPHNGWTVVHLRAASHGENTMENTHPFIKEKFSVPPRANPTRYAVIHNGIWSDYSLAKAAMSPYVDFEGETDSEVAAQLLANVGPKNFGKLVDWGGVFMALQNNGELWVIKTSGDLQMRKTNYGIVIASELPEYLDPEEQPEGYIRFSKTGKLLEQHRFRITYKSIEPVSSPGPSCSLSSKTDDTKPKFGRPW
jgi:predicted glutamine amidotransferase